jgi:flagellar basal body rod protein FlgC
MAKRVAGKRQGLLYGLIAMIFVAILFAVLFFMERSNRLEALQTFAPGTVEPEKIQAQMKTMRDNLRQAGVNVADSATLIDQFKALLAMNADYRQAISNLAYQISGKSPGDAQGSALISFTKTQLDIADAAKAEAKAALEIAPKLPDVAGAQVVDPKDLASAIANLKIHIKALDDAYKARQLDIQKAAQNNEALQATIDSNAKNAEEKFNQMVQTKDAEIAGLRAKVEEVQKLSDEIERTREALKTEFTNYKVAAAEKLQEKINRQIELEKQVRELLDKIQRETSGVAQPDGKIVSLMPGEKTGYIDLAAGDGVFTNLTFAVYDPAEVEAGKEKGYVKIVNVMDTSSEVVITSQLKTNPIVKGDIISNIVYDRTRRFHFAVVGFFDIDGDGKNDIDTIKHMIEKFGGKIDDQFNVRTDYLVVGEDPMSSFKVPTVGSMSGQDKAEYDARSAEQKVYGEATDLAQRFWIPVLNQNRFLTLIGIRPIDEKTAAR